jgi:hypothetical protein
MKNGRTTRSRKKRPLQVLFSMKYVVRPSLDPEGKIWDVTSNYHIRVLE